MDEDQDEDEDDEEGSDLNNEGHGKTRGTRRMKQRNLLGKG